jgi:3'-phosphoadenosine 5'-phosphosulfate sulfotransferase (PAPS reductase)/FAD synthetase
MKIIVQFSGGKDSHACLINAVNEYGADKVEAVFCDTGWEHPDTYTHIDYVVKQMCVRLTVLKGNYDFVSLAEKKKRFPSTKARFCTEELKVKPMIDWILSQNDSLIIIQGIRSGESSARAAMEQECMYFKHYFQPLLNGKTYSYRKKEIIEWCKKYDASVLRPIKSWSAQQVIDCILNAGHKPNPLYYRGFSRVGCFPCIMCRQSEILNIANNDKPMLNRIKEAESKVGRTFFPPGYIPAYACSNGEFPTVDEVEKYVKSKTATLDMFEPEGGYSCMSLFHGLCE